MGPEWAEKILSWRHSGFNVRSRVRARTMKGAAAGSCPRTDGPDGGRRERGVRIKAPGRGERSVVVRPHSGLSRPPRSRPAGSQVLDSRPRPGYPNSVRGRVASEPAAGDLRPSAKRKFLLNPALPAASRVSRRLRAHGLIFLPAPGEACPGGPTGSQPTPVCPPGG